MITIFRGSKIHVVQPTIFPDGTSQVWKLPEWALEKQVHVTWNFEAEREIIDLLSLNQLCNFTVLNVPYLPYARQDKEANNNTTFNLEILSGLLEAFDGTDIKTFDVHSDRAADLIPNLVNVSPRNFHKQIIGKVRPTYIVFPDKGASLRYPELRSLPHFVFEKKRDPETGTILCQVPTQPMNISSGDSFLIVDDLCDYGNTFINVSKTLHEIKENIGVHLCVSHGLFSGGRELLHKSGINEIYTTDSLLRNKGLENTFGL